MSSQCERCGEDYALRDGCEAGSYCDDCAHLLADRYREALERIAEHNTQGTNEWSGHIKIGYARGVEAMRAVAREALKASEVNP